MKKIMSLAIITTLGLWFSGCSMKAPRIEHDINQKASYETIRNPKLNATTTAEIGTNIYSKSYLYTDNTYQIKIDESVFKSLKAGTFDHNLITDVYQNLKPSKYILRKWNKPYTNSLCGIRKYPILCLTDKDDTGYFNHVGNLSQGVFYKLDDPVKYEIKPSPPIPKANSFKYVALYQGKIENKIKISFREFKDDMARPAFTQDIDYELNKDGNTIIGFKGLRIEVLKATNMDITYKVIRDYK